MLVLTGFSSYKCKAMSHSKFSLWKSSYSFSDFTGAPTELKHLSIASESCSILECNLKHCNVFCTFLGFLMLSEAQTQQVLPPPLHHSSHKIMLEACMLYLNHGGESQGQAFHHAGSIKHFANVY